MANRLVDNVYIIDSAMGGHPLLGKNSASWLSGSKVQSFVLWSTDTTGKAVFTTADTTNAVSGLANPNDDPATIESVLGGIYFSDMRVPTLTAGTAWVYFL